MNIFVLMFNIPKFILVGNRKVLINSGFQNILYITGNGINFMITM